MNTLSRDLANALLSRHRRHASIANDPPEVPQQEIDAAIISYGDLLASIGAPTSLAKSIGRYLFEIAVWSEEHGHPPLNALAVNGKLKMPGSMILRGASRQRLEQRDPKMSYPQKVSRTSLTH